MILALTFWLGGWNTYKWKAIILFSSIFQSQKEETSILYS
jgi:hypothetical protein